jgi:hypothetical protein
LEDLEVDGRVILKLILENSVWMRGMDSYSTWWKHVAGSSEHGNGPYGTTKCGKFDELRNYKLLKKDLAAWS